MATAFCHVVVGASVKDGDLFFLRALLVLLLHEVDRLPQGSAAGGRGRYGPRPVAKAAEGVGSGELPCVDAQVES